MSGQPCLSSFRALTYVWTTSLQHSGTSIVCLIDLKSYYTAPSLQLEKAMQVSFPELTVLRLSKGLGAPTDSDWFLGMLHVFEKFGWTPPISGICRTTFVDPCRDRPGRYYPGTSHPKRWSRIDEPQTRLCRHALFYPLSRVFVRRVKRILGGTYGPDRCPLASTSCRGRASMVLMSKPQNLSNSSVARQHSRHPMKRRTRGI